MNPITSKKPWPVQFVLLLYVVLVEFCLSISSDSISQGLSLTGNQTISSHGGIFELGFFSPGISKNYYIGMWYKTVPNKTIVWVANRNLPVLDPQLSKLKLNQNGNLVLLNESNHEVWSTKSASVKPNLTVAILLDSGNFVIRDVYDNDSVIWQSFDYPTDHWLPGGKLGYNKLTKITQSLVPWRSSENPASGIFSVQLEQNGTSHLLKWNDSKVYWTSGAWDGKIFSRVPEIQLNFYVKMFYVSNENESYFSYNATVPSAFSRFLIDSTGQIKQFVWSKTLGQWVKFWTQPEQECQVYAYCGRFSTCDQTKIPPCECIRGFEPKALKNWELGDHSEGCLRKNSLQCGNESDTFVTVPSVINFPANQEENTSIGMEECKLACLRNCSCMAYAFDKDCLVWGEDLMNMKQLSSEDNVIGKKVYVRVAVSDFVDVQVEKNKGETTWILVGSIGAFVIILLGIITLVIYRKRLLAVEFDTADGSLTLFKYHDLRVTTNNFSNKLGKGSFGSVYKGTLPNSFDIAVKELNSLPKPGDKQFRAEVSTIGTIQHINLVRLRGFCVEKSKRFLVYEYMPNGSLESHLFRNSGNILDWKTRFQIAVGTAKGLTYLHESCTNCIIHCDIKPENILLDENFNPKVGDFGLAKLLGREFSRVLTTIRGTRGYLAPEWISGEPITPKADVFSYGMLLLEIISGKRNRDILVDEADDYFPSRVANAINKDEDVFSLLDDRLGGRADRTEALRAINVACWCIQDDEKSRPTMGKVVQILEGVCEFRKSPIPRFIQHLAEDPTTIRSGFFHQEVSSTSH